MLAILLFCALFFNVPNTSGLVMRQCSCSELRECFGVLKEEVETCFVESGEKTEEILQKENISKCFDIFKNFVMEWVNCVGQQLVEKESCLKYKSEKMVEYANFSEIYVTELRKEVDKRMKYLLGLKGNPCWLRNWREEARECTFSKVSKSDIFRRNNCTLKTTHTQVNDAINKCYEKLDLVEVFYKQCECLKNSGFGHLEEYCENVKNAKLPL